MKENIVQIKSEDFSVRIINLFKHLYYTLHEVVLSKQILRSGTSIGANVCEAICSISKNEFLTKMYISYKECNETLFWLRLLKRTEYIDEKGFESLTKDCTELFNILGSITKSTAEAIKQEKEEKKQRRKKKIIESQEEIGKELIPN